MEPNVLTVEQAAERLGIKAGAVRTAIARGALNAIHAGGTAKKAGHLLIPLGEVERYEREVKGRRGKYDRGTKGRWHPRTPENAVPESPVETAAPPCRVVRMGTRNRYHFEEAYLLEIGRGYQMGTIALWEEAKRWGCSPLTLYRHMRAAQKKVATE